MLSYFVTILVIAIYLILFETSTSDNINYDIAVIDSKYMMICFILAMLIIFPTSIAVLKIKHRSMWWLLLFWWYSPLWLPDKKQKCKAQYVYGVILFGIMLGAGFTSFFKYIITNLDEAVFIYGVFPGIISIILASIANFGFNDFALEDLTIYDSKGPEVKEPKEEVPHSELERDEPLQPFSQVLKSDDNN